MASILFLLTIPSNVQIENASAARGVGSQALRCHAGDGLVDSDGNVDDGENHQNAKRRICILWQAMPPFHLHIRVAGVLNERRKRSALGVNMHAVAVSWTAIVDQCMLCGCVLGIRLPSLRAAVCVRIMSLLKRAELPARALAMPRLPCDVAVLLWQRCAWCGCRHVMKGKKFERVAVRQPV